MPRSLRANMVARMPALYVDGAEHHVVLGLAHHPQAEPQRRVAS